jgi:molecular chaperone GrpE (heat shock protein)
MFDRYAQNVRTTQQMADEARKRADDMRANTEAYTAQWQKEFAKISDEEVRRMSEQRVAAAKAEFERVRSAAAEVKAAYAPYRQGLQDVQQYLANDLTAEGVRTIQPKAEDTIRKGEALQQQIATLEKELDTLAGKWSSNLGQPAQPAK